MNKQIRANLKSKAVSTILDSISRQRYVFMSLNILSLSLLDWFLIRPKQKKKNTKLEKGKEGKLPWKQLKVKYRNNLLSNFVHILLPR